MFEYDDLIAFNWPQHYSINRAEESHSAVREKNLDQEEIDGDDFRREKQFEINMSYAFMAVDQINKPSR